MIVCPVCEHPQAQGTVCEVCGKQLVAATPLNIVRDVLPDLETTAVSGALNVAVEPMPDLERHGASPVAVTAERIDAIERTQLPPAPAPSSAEGLTEIEPTRLAEDASRTPVPDSPRCRYCGHVQPRGRICDHCGMRIPTFGTAASAAASEPISCPDCGVKATPGRRCASCGCYIRSTES